MKKTFVRVGELDIALRTTEGEGPTVLLCHGNSCSGRCFERQLAPLGERLRLVAMDLPGHGDSSRAADPARTYTPRGYAEALVGVAREVGALDGGVVVGWSLGGHVVLEASDRLGAAAGLMISGAPPLASSADFPRAFASEPALGAAFEESPTPEQVRALLALYFRPGEPIPEIFLEDFARSDGRARAAVMAALNRGEIRDEVAAVGALKRPLAILAGADRLVQRNYFDGLTMPTLWRGKVHDVPEAGHAVQWDAPDMFNRLLEDFVRDCTARG